MSLLTIWQILTAKDLNRPVRTRTPGSSGERAPNPEWVPHANDRTPIPLWNPVVVHGILADHATNYLDSG